MLWETAENSSLAFPASLETLELLALVVRQVLAFFAASKMAELGLKALRQSAGRALRKRLERLLEQPYRKVEVCVTQNDIAKQKL